MRALEFPSKAQTNVTTTLPVNLYEEIQKAGLQVRALVMRGLVVEKVVDGVEKRLEDMREMMEIWRDKYYMEKYGVTFEMLKNEAKGD